jgi:hypothetical protein
VLFRANYQPIRNLMVRLADVSSIRSPLAAALPVATRLCLLPESLLPVAQRWLPKAALNS